MSLTIFQNGKTPFQAIKTSSLKSPKIDIFPGVFFHPWFSSKNGHFSNFYYLGNIGQKNVFYAIPEQKNAFLGYKNKKLKKSKNRHFRKGVNPWFWSKKCHYSNYHFLSNIGQENVFYDILEQKNALLGHKNKKFKNSKNSHFSKEVNPWFSSKKRPLFQLLFFSKYRPGKCPFRYSTTKKRLSRL